MSAKKIEQFICRSDNFGILIHDPESRATIAIDAPDAYAMALVLEAHDWQLTDILLTHHHEDHVAGVEALRLRYPTKLWGHEKDAHRLPRLDHVVQAGQEFSLAGEIVQVIATPGHTSGQVAYYFPGLEALFAADCLFSLGCGRLFEGTAEDMWPALDHLRKLPGDTKLYCGHEYTQANAKFALHVEPGNQALQKRAKEVEALRQADLVTLPSLLSDECAQNPFLRPESPEIRKYFGLENADNVAVFKALRDAKDQFR